MPYVKFSILLICYCCFLCKYGIRHCYDTCDVIDNQCIIQSTPAIFLSLEPPDAVITTGKVGHVLSSHLDGNERYIYAALIIHCIDCSVAESSIIYTNSVRPLVGS
jgi:hypothetical protein